MVLMLAVAFKKDLRPFISALLSVKNIKITRQWPL